MKFCKDCKHYGPSELSRHLATCIRPQRIRFHPVTGELYPQTRYCEERRKPLASLCGLHGWQWEPKS